MLQWQTANEINTSYFTIERSTNATDFTSIGTIKAGGHIFVNNYSFTDNRHAAGINYYRIKEVDADAGYNYSTVIGLDFNSTAVQVYPNPAHDLVTIYLPYVQSNAIVSLYDATDKLVMQQSVKSNNTKQQINISKLAKGIYYVKLRHENTVQIFKLVKQ